MTTVVCAACVFGVSIGIGGIFLYRFLRRWLQQSLEHQSVNESLERRCVCNNAGNEKEETSSNSTSALNTAAAYDDVVSDSTTQVAENILDDQAGKLRHRSHSSAVFRSASFSGGWVRRQLSSHSVKSASVKCDTICSEPAGDLSAIENSLSFVSKCRCLDGSRQTTETQAGVEKVLCVEHGGTVLFHDTKNFSLLNASFHHSTPEDRDAAAVLQMINSHESESMCFSKDECPYEDIDTSVGVTNVLSWHDSLDIEPSSSRSCISMDDSLFLRDLNAEGSGEAEVLATCTAVSSLEQLEQEVAGVLSDCGDMERCFGMLRRRDSIKAVVGRYSLGVADSVLAADKCICWHESINSPVIDELSLSSSVGVTRHSGFLWDNDGLSADSPSSRFVPFTHRATRSLSPLPTVQHQQADCRASLDAYADSQLNGNLISWTGVENNTSADLAPCSVYDVNRRLSGRLQA